MHLIFQTMKFNLMKIFSQQFSFFALLENVDMLNWQ